MFEEFWLEIRGKVAPPRHAAPLVQVVDDPSDPIDGNEGPPTWAGESISGYYCQIGYTDSKGQVSERAVTCHHISRASAHHYLQGWCHMRQRVRAFRVDRIAWAMDMASGEIFEPGDLLLARFQPDRIQQSNWHWGLSPTAWADLVAALNVLVFIARCDREWHPAERDAIESFVASYWLRAELPHDPPMDDILRHTDRLAPDAETFFVSLGRCAESKAIAPRIRRAIQGVIEADDRIHDHEHFWGSKVDSYFARLG